MPWYKYFNSIILFRILLKIYVVYTNSYAFVVPKIINKILCNSTTSQDCKLCIKVMASKIEVRTVSYKERTNPAPQLFATIVINLHLFNIYCILLKFKCINRFQIQLINLRQLIFWSDKSIMEYLYTVPYILQSLHYFVCNYSRL